MFFGVFLLLLRYLIIVLAIRHAEIEYAGMPEPYNAAHVSVLGPYQYIRHPMFTLVVLFAIGVLCLSVT